MSPLLLLPLLLLLALSRLPLTSPYTPYNPPPNSQTGSTNMSTGGTSWFGLETCKRLLPTGARVILTSRTEEKGDLTISELGGKGEYVVMDLTSFSSVRSGVDDLVGMLNGGQVDVLLNNAGVMAVPTR